MANLKIDYEWVDPLGARGAELRATWARLRIAVDDQAVTQVYDRVVKAVRDSIYLPLYPLAEWIATHWWFLLGELENPGKRVATDYDTRHCIRFGQEGYALPPLTIRPVGTYAQLHWEPVSARWMPLDFIGSGSRYIAVDALAQILGEFVQAVIARLQDQGVQSTLLEEEWVAITQSNAEERQFALAAALLGEDAYALGDDDAARIVEVSRTIPAEALTEFLATATLGTLEASQAAFRRSVEDAVAQQGYLRTLADIKRQLGQVHASGLPWEFGYALAQRTRSVIGLNGSPVPTDALLAGALGVPADDYEAAIARGVEAPGVDAVVATSEDDSPGFAVSARFENAVRFSFCRGLCEYLTGQRSSVELVTRTHSDRQKANRAFAAEFLVPAATLRDTVTSDTVGSEEIDDLGIHFGVSPFVIYHQLENHRIARVSVQ